MDCAEEVALIHGRLDHEPSIRRLTFDVFHGRMTVEFDPAALTPERIMAMVAETGLHAEPWKEAPAAGRSTRPVVWISGIALLAGLAAEGLRDGSVVAFLAHHHEETPPPAILGLFVIAIAAGLIPVVRKGLRTLLTLRPDMNALVLVSVCCASALGEWAEAATLAFLFALAGRLEHWSIARARAEVGDLLALAPQKASVVHGDHEHRVSVERVKIGSLVRVRPGEYIPCDGIVRDGSSNVDESVITGEAAPVPRSTGDEVLAGTLNVDGTLRIETTHAASATRLARILRMIEESQQHRAPSERFIDRFARRYTPAMFALAFVVMVGPPLASAGSWADWFYRGMLVLLISCPCALVISTPVTIAAALASAARRGVLIKGGAYLEEAARIRALAIDKTGVITVGQPQVRTLQPLDGHSRRDTLQRLASLESYSRHPLARAIVEYARTQGIAPGPVARFRSLRGKGAEGTIDDAPFWVGSARLLEEQAASEAQRPLRRGANGESNTPVPGAEASPFCADSLEDLRNRICAMEDSEHTVVACGAGSEAWALVSLTDPVRSDAAAVISLLRRQGLERLVLLTGDNNMTAQAVGERVGISDVRGELLPDQKTAAIQALLREERRVAMVGDGINDGDAIAAASLGIGFGAGGADVALEPAGVIIVTPRLENLPFLFRHARRSQRVIYQNVGIALLFKAAFLALAAADMATLWMAVAADMGATLLVIFNGLRLLRVTK